MEYRDLLAFQALARQLHFARAAEQLHLSQPALTKQIRRLEQSLGGELFQRGPGGTRLSWLGEQLLDEAGACLNTFERFRERARHLVRGETGRVRIGFGFHTLELVPRLLMRLRAEAPEVHIGLRDMSTREQLEALEQEEIDIGFLRWPVPGPWQTLPVIEDELVLAGNRDRPVTDLSQCRDLPFILISSERSPTLYQHALRMCAERGFAPRVVQQVPEVTTALALVRAGMGVSLLPGSFFRDSDQGVTVSALTGLEARWTVGAAWKKGDGNPVLQRFLRLLEDQVGAASG